MVPGLIARWLALNPSEHHENRLRDFGRFGMGLSLSDVDRDTLLEYRRYLNGRTYTVHNAIDQQPHHLAVATIRDRVRVAASVLRWGLEHGWCVMPTVPRLSRPVRRAKDIPIRKLQADLDAMPVHASRVFRFLVATGARPSEVVGLRWQDVDMDAGVANVSEHKTGGATGKQRTIYPDACGGGSSEVGGKSLRANFSVTAWKALHRFGPSFDLSTARLDAIPASPHFRSTGKRIIIGVGVGHTDGAC